MAAKHDQITERVVSTAERLEGLEDPDEMEVLEVRVSASLDGTAREFTAVLTTGGPHIEANLTNGTVSGSWGGESHTTHCDADVFDALEARYEQDWKFAQTDA